MEVQLFVRNLSGSATREELDQLFRQAGEMISVRLMDDLKSGESKGYAVITMGAQSEADRAVSMFDLHSLDEHRLRGCPTQPRQQRGFV
jgi:RNA recognition motif-containing protein